MRIYSIRAVIVITLIISSQYQSLFAFHNDSLPKDTFEYHASLRPVYYYVNTTDRDGLEHTDRTI